MSKLIPKVIHYCWFGRKEKPALAKKCIASWNQFLPDYEIKEWNEDNYDVNKIKYTAQAYTAKKYAFVSDYARFDILYKYGGLYFDTDVEIIKPIDDIVRGGPFMGMETNPDFSLSAGSHEKARAGLGMTIAPGLGLGVEAGNKIYKAIIERYKSLAFLQEDGGYNQTTVVTYITDLFFKRGLSVRSGIIDFEGLKIYPREYFNPKSPDGSIRITDNTRTIHHFGASWYSPRQRIVQWVVNHVGLFPGRLVGLCLRNPLTVPKRIYDFFKRGA